MEWTTLRARAAARVRELAPLVPNPWDLDVFLARFQHQHERRIQLYAMPWRGGPTGSWRREAHADVIVYPDNTTVGHQEHIVLHELAHLYSDHHGQCVLSEQHARQLGPQLAPPAFLHVLPRETEDHEEIEAETIATMMLAQLTARPDRMRRHPTGESTSVTKLTLAFDQR